MIRSDNCWLSARCILSPTSAEDVSRILRIVTFTGAKFATRSGGHNPNVGYSSVDGTGLLIDMVNMNQTQLSSDNKTISLGPGQRFGPAYEQLSKLGFYFNAGRNPEVGVGGLFLGGKSFCPVHWPVSLPARGYGILLKPVWSGRERDPKY